MKWLKIISRILVGAVFTFSGFVKLVDPMGSAYKFHDYFTSMHLPMPESVNVALAVLLSVAEMVVGLGLLVGVAAEICTWGAIAFMTVFTPLTLWVAIANPVHDCGCFGDALIISNWATFYKNVVIDLLVGVLFWQRKNFKPMIDHSADWFVFMGLFLISSIFGFRNLYYSPVFDFRPYKVGTVVADGMKIPAGMKGDEYGVDYTIANSKTKQTKIISSADYLATNVWQDTTWKITNTSESKLIKKGYTPPIHDLKIESVEADPIDGYTVAQDLLPTALADQNFNVWLIAYDLKKTDLKSMAYASEVAKFCKQNHYKFYCLTSASKDEITEFKQKYKPAFNFFLTDGTTLKTIIRSNQKWISCKRHLKNWISKIEICSL
jgi:uncharacterized membrane protein YphA (DoxX/SURF4 family)